MRKIEKPTIKHKPMEKIVPPTPVVMDSPYGNLNEAFPDCKDKLKYAWEHEVLDEDNFKPPTQFFISDAFGGMVFFRTNSRANAQRLCEMCFGKKYTVKIVVRAAIR